MEGQEALQEHRGDTLLPRPPAPSDPDTADWGLRLQGCDSSQGHHGLRGTKSTLFSFPFLFCFCFYPVI